MAPVELFRSASSALVGGCFGGSHHARPWGTAPSTFSSLYEERDIVSRRREQGAIERLHLVSRQSHASSTESPAGNWRGSSRESRDSHDVTTSLEDDVSSSCEEEEEEREVAGRSRSGGRWTHRVSVASDVADAGGERRRPEDVDLSEWELREEREGGGSRRASQLTMMGMPPPAEPGTLLAGQHYYPAASATAAPEEAQGQARRRGQGRGGRAGSASYETDAALALALQEEEDLEEQRAAMQRKPKFVGVKRVQDLPSWRIEMEHLACSTAENLQCMICLNNYEVGDAVRLLPCMHRFHIECSDPWFKQSQYCPMCKLSVFTGKMQQETPARRAPAQTTATTSTSSSGRERQRQREQREREHREPREVRLLREHRERREREPTREERRDRRHLRMTLP